VFQIDLAPQQLGDFTFAGPGKRQHFDDGYTNWIGICRDFSQSTPEIYKLTRSHTHKGFRSEAECDSNSLKEFGHGSL
jgi:hypothetical protein